MSGEKISYRQENDSYVVCRDAEGLSIYRIVPYPADVELIAQFEDVRQAYAFCEGYAQSQIDRILAEPDEEGGR